MRKKYVGAIVKTTKGGASRYMTKASMEKAKRLKTLAAQAAEKATHGKVIQASEIYRDDLIEDIIFVILEEKKEKEKKEKKDKDDFFSKFKKKKKDKDDDDDDDDDEDDD